MHTSCFFCNFAIDNISLKLKKVTFHMMKTVNCPKCGKEVVIDIARAVDEDGEEFVCDHCGYHFRYAE